MSCLVSSFGLRNECVFTAFCFNFVQLALEYDSPHVFLSCGEDAVTYEIDLRDDKPNR